MVSLRTSERCVDVLGGCVGVLDRSPVLAAARGLADSSTDSPCPGDGDTDHDCVVLP